MKAIALAVLCITQPLPQPPGGDKGIGVLSIVDDELAKLQFDIYEGRSDKSKVLARYTYENKGNGDRRYIVEAGRGMAADNLMEIAYERKGIPVVEVKDQWLRIAYGVGDSGIILTGWIKSKKGVTLYSSWKDLLLSKMLFFEKVDDIAFFKERGGSRYEFKLRKLNDWYDYIMEPLKVEGNWMMVEVNTPSDYCRNPMEKETQVLWIKYLDENGRPLVWYFARGC